MLAVSAEGQGSNLDLAVDLLLLYAGLGVGIVLRADLVSERI